MATEKTVSAKEALKIADAAAAKGDREKAIKYYNAVLQKYPDHEKAIAGYRKLHPNSLFRSDIDDLMKLFAEGKYKEVEVRAGMLIELYPNVFELWSLMGSVLSVKGDMDQALNYFKKASVLAPYNATTHINLANTYLATGDVKRAKSSFQQVIKLDPKYVGSYIEFARIYMREENYKAAAELYKEASKLSPKSAEILTSTAVAFKASGQFVEAIKYYRSAIDLGGTNLRVFVDLADCELSIGNIDEAKRIFDIIISEGPENYMAHFQYGLMLRKIGDDAAADEQFAKAIKLNPDLKVPGKVN
ncbi:MAG: tetratricopeptide repeat protein [Alphaproteobacteria bacterium]|nr:tetratricopeptide repeat protein [Alphaproteobacteria bacterium]HPF46441.1 tetratricopeptide repeat protein [Emcibacteraceae bacterium]HRW29048.1 tetratricopeptide repeat protein [Emcibacteraceae bacterium]